MIDYKDRRPSLLQIGDLVKYNPENRWKTSRSWANQEDSSIGVVLEVTQYKDEQEDEVGRVHVKWSNGEKKVYFEEELDIISKKVL